MEYSFCAKGFSFINAIYQYYLHRSSRDVLLGFLIATFALGTTASNMASSTIRLGYFASFVLLAVLCALSGYAFTLHSKMKRRSPVLYASRYGKPALALDIMEEFRPTIVDSVVLTLLNNRQLEPKDFIMELNSYRMTDATKRLFLQ